jgi:uroporphyrinogen III methyltransferase/synthase
MSKVFLIGAGPGDPGLVTAKMLEIIKVADVIIYDNLVNKHILKNKKDNVEMIYVGKQASCHSLAQSKINELLVEKAKANSIVVRLKGGDPFVFGRGSEEAEYLFKNNIDFEIIPGITSALAAPAYAGIPVTDRRFASSFTVITGHEDPDKPESFHKWDVYASMPGTLIILMAVKNLEAITKKLIHYGRNPQEPAAIVHWGTTPAQKVISGLLADIADLARSHNIIPPSILVIGEVVTLRETLNWYETLPLFGKNIVITRSIDQADSFNLKLSALGANVILFPVIETLPVNDFKSIDSALQSIRSYDWLIFTSTNGIKHFFDRLFYLNLDSRILSGIKIAVIGDVTGLELKKYGIKYDFMPDTYTSDCLAEGLIKHDNLSGKRIMLARSNIASTEILEKLEKAGAEVKNIDIYLTTKSQKTDTSFKQIALETPPDVITFTSPSTVINFADLPGEVSQYIETALIASIGPVTSQTCLKYFGRVDIEASKHTTEGLVEAIVDYYVNVLN